MRFLLVISFLLLTSNASADQPQVTRDNISKWIRGEGLELGKKNREASVKELRTKLRAAQSARISARVKEVTIANNGAVIVPNRDLKEILVNDLKDKIAEAEKPLPALPDLSPHLAAKGQIGYLPAAFEVQQIVDEKNAIIKIRESSAHPWATIWLNASTEGMADERWYKRAELFEVVGTKRYETVIGGSKTVIMVAPCSLKDVLSKEDLEWLQGL